MNVPGQRVTSSVVQGPVKMPQRLLTVGGESTVDAQELGSPTPSPITMRFGSILFLAFVLLSALAMGESENDRYEELLSQAESNFQLGHLELALIQRGQALDLARKMDNASLFARALFKSGQSDLALGHYNQAQSRFIRCARLYKQLKDKLGESQCYLELGNLFALSSRTRQAKSYYGRAESILGGPEIIDAWKQARLRARLNQAFVSPESTSESLTHLYSEYLQTHPGPAAELWLGTLLLEKGRLDVSLQLLRTARMGFQAEGNNLGYLRASLNLASVLHRVGSPEASLDTIYESLDQVPFELALPKDLEARLALLMIRLLPEGRERENWTVLARDRLNATTRADFLLSQIEQKVAEGELETALHLLKGLSSADTEWQRARRTLVLGQIAIKQGRFEQAVAAFQAVLRQSDASKIYSLSWRARLGLARSVKDSRPDEALTHYQQALDDLDRIRGQLGQDELRTNFAQDKRPLYNELISLLIEQGQIVRAFEVSELARARSLLESLREENRLEVPQKVMNWSEVKSWLPRNATILSYWVGAETSHVFVANKKSLKVREIPLGHSQLRGLVGRLRPERWYNARQLPPFDQESSQTLHRALIPKTLLGDSDRLLIVPDGPLHHLSFAALGQKHYLIAEHPISYSNSVTVASALAPGSSTLTSIRVYAGPHELPDVLRDGRVAKFGALPHTLREAQAIKSSFPRSKLSLGTEALESTFYKDLQKSPHSALHFATHSFTNPRNPMDAGLILQKETGTHDGILLVREILDLTIDSELVVLSSCHSGMGRLAGTEGIVGLVRAFQMAGAKRVVSTLWQISDSSTAILMEHFYQELEDGIPVPDALRKAQLKAISGRFPHPYQWAAFVANGTAW